MPGAFEYRVKAVRLDKLTGECRLIIVAPQIKKSDSEEKLRQSHKKDIWNQLEEIEEKE